ncbi:MAG TPA: hypothetical protein VN929_01180 [Burkholderiales bacterium]|nr:hypothetical protein [Burkholderiales bacterium]
MQISPEWKLRLVALGLNAAFVLAPVIVGIGLYWYCQSYESACKTQREHEEERRAQTNRSDRDVYVLDVSNHSYGRIAESNSIKSEQSPTCSLPCQIVKETQRDAVAFFTGVLAYFVYLQIIWMTRQERVLQASVRAAEKSARAAEQSAQVAVKALTDLERPWIFFEATHVQRREHPGEPMIPNNFFISFVCRNVGRAPAIIEACFAKIQNITTLPEIPDYSAPIIPLRCPATVATNVDFETSAFGPAPQPGIDPNSAIRYVVYGKMTYKELNGTVHHTGFAVEVSPHMAAASAYSSNAYDYYD